MSRGRAPLRPLRRTPKQLSSAPLVFDATSGVGGLTGSPSARSAGIVTGTAGSDRADDDLGGAVVNSWHLVEPDPLVRAAALTAAARVALSRPPRARRPRRGRGGLETLPFSAGSSEVDLDRMLDRLVEGSVHSPQDVLVRERVSRRRSVVLAIDVSGSMRGERVTTAAAVLAGVSTELGRDDLAVLAFWSDAAVLLRFGDPVRPLALVDTLLRLPAEGLTNVALPLEVAAAQLARCAAGEARVLLLSDCMHNAGPDPRLLAARLPRLDVLLDETGQHDIDLAGDLAHAGRGRLTRLRGPRDVAKGLRRVFLP